MNPYFKPFQEEKRSCAWKQHILCWGSKSTLIQSEWDNKITHLENPMHPWGTWKIQSPQQTAPCFSPCMGLMRMKMRTSGENCAPIEKQKSCSRSLVFASFSGSKLISFYRARLETRMVIKWKSKMALGRSCPNNVWIIAASLCLALLYSYLFWAALSH